MKKVYFLIQEWNHPASRYRVLQYIPYLKESQIDAKVALFPDSFLKWMKFFSEIQEYDVVFVSNLVHIYAPETNIGILKKCYEALESGGKVVIHDFLLDSSGAGPLFPALFSLCMLLGTCEGASYGKKDLETWLLKAGFKRPKAVRLDKDSGLVIGEKQ